MKDLFEDKDHLKLNLWPAPEGLYVHQDVGSFWSTFNLSRMQAGVCERNQFSKNMAKTIVDALECKGICELQVHNEHFFFPVSWFMTN